MKTHLVERKEHDVVITMTIEEAKNLRSWMERHQMVINITELDRLQTQLNNLRFTTP